MKNRTPLSVDRFAAPFGLEKKARVSKRKAGTGLSDLDYQQPSAIEEGSGFCPGGIHPFDGIGSLVVGADADADSGFSWTGAGETVSFDGIELPRFPVASNWQSRSAGRKQRADQAIKSQTGGSQSSESQFSESQANGSRVASTQPQLALPNVFALQSKADARHTIYLDFNGHTTANTQWNETYNNGNNFTTSAFTMDGSASFSTAEREVILDVWRRVAEDFRPFNVNVTTAAPSTARLIKSSNTDPRWGIRVVIGGSANQWLGGSAAGIAYQNSFNFNSDTPAFIFTDDFYISDKNVAEAASHEIGHTLGLLHDGRKTPQEEYYAGHGSGDTGWAPIMGLGYYQTLTQWSKGEYASASTTEDDLRIITTQNGFGYRNDDHANTIVNATILELRNNNYVGSGIIEKNTDYDFFSLGIQVSGEYQLNVLPYFKGPNLDLKVTLFDQAGNGLQSFNPTDQLGVTTRIGLQTNHYYLRVEGVGKSGADGYSDYGSLGSYAMRILPINIDVVVPTIQIFQQDAAKAEGNTGGKNFTFRLIRQGNLKIESQVDWRVTGVSASNTVDRFDFANNQFASGVATFEFGSHVTLISVPVKTDRIWEPHERMQVTISNALNGVITKATVVGTIFNDDPWGANGLALPDQNGQQDATIESLAMESPVRLDWEGGAALGNRSGGILELAGPSASNSSFPALDSLAGFESGRTSLLQESNVSSGMLTSI